MDDRAEFEQWVNAFGYTPTYFQVWQAATARQRERDAQIALEQRCERDTPWDLACVALAEAIRRQP